MIKKVVNKKNKKGQFYLIAAIIIIGVVIGVTALTNYVLTRPKPVKFYDLSKELNLESEQVINYGIYNNPGELENILEDFADTYSDYFGEGEADVYFIYGNEQKVNVIAYTTEPTGSFSLIIGGTDIDLVIIGTYKYKGEETGPFTPGELVDVVVGGTTYNFNLKEGQNFFFVVEQEVEGSRFVAT